VPDAADIARLLELDLGTFELECSLQRAGVTVDAFEQFLQLADGKPHAWADISPEVRKVIELIEQQRESHLPAITEAFRRVAERRTLSQVCELTETEQAELAAG
jgi:hypothetical protein